MTRYDPAPDEPKHRTVLSGRRIAVFEHRELDRMARMLEAQGADVMRCPLVTIVDAPDRAPVLAWIGRAIGAPFDDLILMTGEGLRRLRGFARDAGIEPEFCAALGRMRTITRGPKPAKALREIGLSPRLRVPIPTTDGVIAALSGLDLRGRRVGAQLYPEAGGRLVEFLGRADALPDPVLPYAYVPESDRGSVVAYIDEIAAGHVDVAAFTSASQVATLFDLAADKTARLRRALKRTAVAAVGPVVAAELQRRGVAVAVTPHDTFFMKPLVSAITAFLSR